MQSVRTIAKIDDNGEVLDFRSEKFKVRNFKEGTGGVFRPRSSKATVYRDIFITDIVTDDNDLSRITKLQECVQNETNIICHNKRRRTKPANIEDISKIIGLSDKRTKEFMKRMKDIGLIAEIIVEIKDYKYVSFVFNPVYFNACRYIDKTVYMLFKQYLDEHFPDWILEEYDKMLEDK